MISWDDIVAIVRNRQMNNGDLLEKMIEVRRRYNADWVVPYVSEMDSEVLPPTTPALIAEAIDFLGMRAASVMPYMNSPAIDPTKEVGVRSREFAATRRKILGATHHQSKTKLHMRRAMRHLAGYSTASMIVVPDFETCLPRLELRDPLSSYPEPKAAEDLSPPKNCAFVYTKSVDWLRQHYPQVRNWVASSKSTGEEMWDIVEWVDEDVTVVGVLGPRDWESRTLGASGSVVQSMELHRWPNPTGICPVYIPGRVTLDKIISQIANLTGQVDLMAQLQALSIAAGEKAIFRDRFIIGDSIKAPQLVGGQWKDGRTGEMNIILDAKNIGELAGTPDPSTQMMIDRLERNVRIGTGLVPQAGGETYGALRTGRGMDSMLGTAVDPRIQEMQEIMEVALEQVNSIMLEQYRTYWPDKKFVMFSGWPGDKGTVEFTPSIHIETTDNVVAYTIPGSDVQGTTIQLGQLLGMKAISLHTLRSRHPYIDDPDAESARVEEETIEEALLQGLANQAAQGAIPVTYLAMVEKHRRREPDLVQAILKADAEMKAEQAKMAPPPEQGQFAAPEQMPGLSGPAPIPPSMSPEEMQMQQQGGPAPSGSTSSPQGTPPGDINQLLAALQQKPPVGA
ncbi:MAG: hypothetical protein EBR30_12040 [Cytophagia bacterium]|nr:hypothetical protein [Cytophagia bacterium]